MKTGRPKGQMDPTLKIQRERMYHELEMKDIDLQMSREKLIADLLHDPRIFYTVCIAGSAGIGFLQMLIQNGSAPAETTDNEAIIKKLKQAFAFLSGGFTGLVIEEWMSGDGNWMDKLLKNAGAGGTIFFATCLLMHEIYSGHGDKQGGLGEFMKAMAVA